jgi:release factor glutamine methyltransferase
MTYRELTARIRKAIGEEPEAQAVVRMILELGVGVSWADALCGALDHLPSADQKRLATIVEQVESGTPVQYAIGQTTFCNRLFEVQPAVLIPRPETEELCRWIVEDHSSSIPHSPLRLLDIGTGSGCIAITLALDLPQAHVDAIDISEEALAVARRNASRLGAEVDFHQMDILAPLWEDKRGISLIVSNPPYICEYEKADMAPHVLNHEPSQALFVPDDDPLLFYRAIAHFAQSALKPAGELYFEVNALYAEEVKKLLIAMGYRQVVVRKDAFGKPRFVKAVYG